MDFFGKHQKIFFSVFGIFCRFELGLAKFAVPMRVVATRPVPLDEISIGDDSGWRAISKSRVQELKDEIVQCQWGRSTLAPVSLLVTEQGARRCSRESELDGVYFTGPRYFAILIAVQLPIFVIYKITLLRVIPNMTFIHFVTGKPSGILSDIHSGILSGISCGILSGISSGILAGISFAICSGISSGTLSGISSGISSGILSGIYSDILSGISCGIQNILSGISSDILSDISSDILSGISSDILSGISSDILSDILSGILSGISSDILSGISSDILSDIFSHILFVEVRQCPLRSGSRG